MADPNQPREATYLKLDCSKARALFGWSPVCRLPNGLRLAVEWYKHYYADSGNTQSIRAKTQEQIANYQATAGLIELVK